MSTVAKSEDAAESGSEHVSSASDELREWVKCKGGLPFCNLMFSHIHEKAVQEDAKDVLELLEQVPNCKELIIISEVKTYNDDYETDLEFVLMKVLECIDKNGGYCEESDLLQSEILVKSFLPKLEESGIKSLGQKPAAEIKLMLANLAFFNFFLRHILPFVQTKIDGKIEEKLVFLAEKLSDFIIKISPESKALVKALRYVLCVDYKHSMSCQTLECGPNWETFVFDFVKEPTMSSSISVLDFI